MESRTITSVINFFVTNNPPSFLLPIKSCSEKKKKISPPHRRQLYPPASHVENLSPYFPGRLANGGKVRNLNGGILSEEKPFTFHRGERNYYRGRKFL